MDKKNKTIIIVICACAIITVVSIATMIYIGNDTEKDPYDYIYQNPKKYFIGEWELKSMIVQDIEHKDNYNQTWIFYENNSVSVTTQYDDDNIKTEWTNWKASQNKILHLELLNPSEELMGTEADLKYKFINENKLHIFISLAELGIKNDAVFVLEKV